MIVLCDLPTELFYEVLSHLDNASLVQLALTCKRLQHISLNTFFERNDLQFECLANRFTSYESPPETLPALRAALWVKEFRSFYFYFNPGMDRLAADIQDMYWIVKRLQKVDLVKLNFSLVDYWTREWRNRIQVFDCRRWSDAFSALLEVIVEKGCTELEISGSGIMEGFWFSSPEDEKSIQRCTLETIPPALEGLNRQSSRRQGMSILSINLTDKRIYWVL